MIRELRKKFIAASMLAILIVLALIIGIIDIANYLNVDKSTRQRMEMLIENEGSFENLKQQRMGMQPPEEGAQPQMSQSRGLFNNNIMKETPFDARYFSVDLDEAGAVSTIHLDSIASVTEETATAMATEVLSKDKTTGYYQGFRYAKATKSDGTNYYVFLDCNRELATFSSFFRASLIVSAIGALSYLVLVLIFSKIVLRPVAESYEKQKRFITDASHEIKTPLAIIDANTEVIEMEEGESEWTKSIRNQIKRLTSLTEKLVFLSRMDEESTKLEMREFDLSGLLDETIDSYEAVAISAGKTLERVIAPNVRLYGDETNILQMITLLMDNAMKYSNEQGNILVKMEQMQKGKHRLKLTFRNTVEEIAVGNHDEFFERFYRADESRSTKTGGHGIGLSVVKAIVAAHHGKVTAESKDGKSLQFVIML
ncbi:MAG: HAMP domain-containing histidine kinase [Lachnospiraceae bacterium]|jgi:signal transduction histidine kinase|nr:HAMP domain-containing histidine kinase [Lachnospiraceae bacterium]